VKPTKEKVGGIQMHVGTEDVLPLGVNGAEEDEEADPQTSNGDERHADHGAVLEGGMACLVERTSQAKKVEQHEHVANRPARYVSK